MMWTELLTKRELQYNLQKKLVDAIFTQPPLGLFLKKFQKCIAFHFPIMPCYTIAENKVHHCTQGKRT